MTDLTRFRLAGLFILAAFPLYGIGQGLLPDTTWRLGLIMVVLNSIGVLLIGVLLRPIIARHSLATSALYLIARSLEAVLLALGALILVGLAPSWGQSPETLYHAGMIALGIGSLPFCCWLIRTERVPIWLGGLGIVGYLCLIAGMIAAEMGFTEASMTLLAPGAVFEIIFGLMLVMGRVDAAPVTQTPAMA